MAQQDVHLRSALDRVLGRKWRRNQLCSTCESIPFAQPSTITAHLHTAKAIKEAAYQGCHMCSLLHACFPLVAQEDWQPSSAVLLDGPRVAEINSWETKSPHQITIDCRSKDHWSHRRASLPRQKTMTSNSTIVQDHASRYRLHLLGFVNSLTSILRYMDRLRSDIYVIFQVGLFILTIVQLPCPWSKI